MRSGPADSPDPGKASRPEGMQGLDKNTLEEMRRCVLTTVLKMFPSRLGQQAEDIAQDVLMQVVEAVARGHETAEFSPGYVSRAAHGAAVDEIRRRCRRREEFAPAAALERAASEQASPERCAESAEIGRAICDCVSRLGLPRRLAVTLHLAGCSVPEIAGLLGWPEKRAENLVYRGLAAARICLRRKGYGV